MVGLPTLRSGRLTWVATSRWNPSAAFELRAAGSVLAEGEWIDSEPREWRVEVGTREFAFRVAGWRPMSVEATLLPERTVQLAHRGSLAPAKPPIEIGDRCYRFVQATLSRTAYREVDGSMVARVEGHPGWTGKLHIDLFESSCPDWHLWLLACYTGFRYALQHRNPFNLRTTLGLKQLCDSRSPQAMNRPSA